MSEGDSKGEKDEKQPFYQSESFRSAITGGIVAGGVMKFLGWGTQEIRKKIEDLRHGKLEYERKEEERRAAMYAKISTDAAKQVLEDYFKDRRQSQLG